MSARVRLERDWDSPHNSGHMHTKIMNLNNVNWSTRKEGDQGNEKFMYSL